MRVLFVSILLICLNIPLFGQDANIDSSAVDPQRLARVGEWLQSDAGFCPPAARVSAVQRFLGEMRERRPALWDQLLEKKVPSTDDRSEMLRLLGASLNGPANADLREKVAIKRIALVTASDSATGQSGAMELLAKVKAGSEVYHRRILEGRIEDEELRPLLSRFRPGTKANETAAAEPKTLSAANLVSEFSRHNQSGSALSRLRAYTLTGKVTSITGDKHDIVLCRLRPNRFRLTLDAGTKKELVTVGDGSRFWQENEKSSGPRSVSSEALGDGRYLSEFVDPLFGGEGYNFERLPDETFDGKKVYRLQVERPDSSRYVACLDQTNFQQVAREFADGSVTRFSDFREAAGITRAYLEETSNRDGKKSSFQVDAFVPNTGLIEALFEAHVPVQPNYFVLQQAISEGAEGVTR